MIPRILFRPHQELGASEVWPAEKHFPIVTSRMDVPPESLVIGRYSVLPFYRELVDDLKRNGSRLINSYHEHRYIADLGNYVDDIADLTPPTFRMSDILQIEDHKAYDGYFLKGETNSRKFLWNTHAHAPTKADISTVYLRLMEDSLIQDQAIYVRRLARLKTFFTGLHGVPITNEYRTFCFRDKLLATGFYWSNYADDIPVAQRTPPPVAFLEAVAKRISEKTNFFVVDTALTANGAWIVVELNDGQMSGLSECDPEELYANLARTVKDG